MLKTCRGHTSPALKTRVNRSWSLLLVFCESRSYTLHLLSSHAYEIWEDKRAKLDNVVDHARLVHQLFHFWELHPHYIVASNRWVSFRCTPVRSCSFLGVVPMLMASRIKCQNHLLLFESAMPLSLTISRMSRTTFR